MEQTEPGYRIENVFLMECKFERIINVSFNKEKSKPLVDISVSCEVAQNKVVVTETLNFEMKQNDVIEVYALIKMVGIFEKVGNVPIEPEEFGRINGAAILYPYIRENLSNISLKAGIGNILLPTANFINLKSDKESTE